VEDSGPGIPVEKWEKLFFQFQDSLDELCQGTGIGLSLCKKLVDLMDGTIALDESRDSGIPGKPGSKLDIQIKCDVINIDAVLSVTDEEDSDETPDMTQCFESSSLVL
jgi:signal transduction histidine kinase